MVEIAPQVEEGRQHEVNRAELHRDRQENCAEYEYIFLDTVKERSCPKGSLQSQQCEKGSKPLFGDEVVSLS